MSSDLEPAIGYGVVRRGPYEGRYIEGVIPRLDRLFPLLDEPEFGRWNWTYGINPPKSPFEWELELSGDSATVEAALNDMDIAWREDRSVAEYAYLCNPGMRSVPPPSPWDAGEREVATLIRANLRAPDATSPFVLRTLGVARGVEEALGVLGLPAIRRMEGAQRALEDIGWSMALIPNLLAVRLAPGCPDPVEAQSIDEMLAELRSELEYRARAGWDGLNARAEVRRLRRQLNAAPRGLVELADAALWMGKLVAVIPSEKDIATVETVSDPWGEFEALAHGPV